MVAKSLNEKYLTFTSFRAGIAAGQKETPPKKKPPTIPTVLWLFISIN